MVISLLPEKLTETEVAEGTVVTRPVSDEPLARKNSIIWHKQKFLSDATKDFIELRWVYCLQDKQ
ncbi:MAG: LysR substrate-binding domain-containing protein [Sphaerochaetaceae bacterium]|jgi:DNA-binding transcriptional LysR family regulator|nr:LysR substrate-binding domain-containing protein [Sphaerochaetaceae bacterium]MDD4396197.1 LysR substrate-binding domain-containing protein [Sphaerochaetaceae bacterium]